MPAKKRLRKLRLFLDWGETLDRANNTPQVLQNLRKALRSAGFEVFYYVLSSTSTDAVKQGVQNKGLESEIEPNGCFGAKTLRERKNLKQELHFKNDLCLLIDEMTYDISNNITNTVLRAKVGCMLGLRETEVDFDLYLKHTIRYDKQFSLEHYANAIIKMAKKLSQKFPSQNKVLKKAKAKHHSLTPSK